jgi:hypothetical protein
VADIATGGGRLKMLGIDFGKVWHGNRLLLCGSGGRETGRGWRDKTRKG